jgi:hypothetical protein
MVVNLPSSKNVVLKQKKTDKLTVAAIIDHPQRKVVKVIIKEFGRQHPVILWSGDNYREWNKQDIGVRLLELYA